MFAKPLSGYEVLDAIIQLIAKYQDVFCLKET